MKVKILMIFPYSLEHSLLFVKCIVRSKHRQLLVGTSLFLLYPNVKDKKKKKKKAAAAAENISRGWTTGSIRSDYTEGGFLQSAYWATVLFSQNSGAQDQK